MSALGTHLLLNSSSIGLVLSGGGVRGMAHIGLIQAMEELGITAQMVSGSSVGALVGALYANGSSVSDMLRFFKETPLFKYSFFTILKPGLIDTERYFDIFKEYIPKDAFESLERQLYIVATDLQQGEQHFFSEGELIRPLLASAALPPVFSPVELNGKLYADGGIMNNFPLEPIQNKVDYVIGSNVSAVGQLHKNALNNSIQLTGRVTNLMIYAINKKKLRSCNLLLEYPELEKIGVLDRTGIEKAYKMGYELAMSTLEVELERAQTENRP